MSIGPFKFAKRHTFIVDPEGRIGKVYRKVSPREHKKATSIRNRKLRSVPQWLLALRWLS
jgi:peroxiredoxin Q/BCP